MCVLPPRFRDYLDGETFMFWLAGGALLSGAFCALVFRRRVCWHKVRLGVDRLWSVDDVEGQEVEIPTENVRLVVVQVASNIGVPSEMGALAKRYVQHLNKDSFYKLD